MISSPPSTSKNRSCLLPRKLNDSVMPFVSSVSENESPNVVAAVSPSSISVVRKKVSPDTCFETAPVTEHDFTDESEGGDKLKRSLSRRWIVTLVDRYFLSKTRTICQRIPSNLKYGCFLFWLLWKVGSTAYIMYILYCGAAYSSQNANKETKHAASVSSPSRSLQENNSALRVLYIVTSLAEYNTGKRETVAGSDRLVGLVLPVLNDSVKSMIGSTQSIDVDVYLILAYKLSVERENMIRDMLPEGCGIQIWDDACPIGYDKGGDTKVKNNTRALARQHRYVIKDKLPFYDMFISVEDDMRVTGSHVLHYLEVSNEIEARRQISIKEQNEANVQYPLYTEDPQKEAFFGPLTEMQWDRLMPGFIRVEVLMNEKEHGAQSELDPFQLSYPISANNSLEVVHFDPHVCCHVQTPISLFASTNQNTKNATQGDTIALKPGIEDVIVWETSVKALSVRQLPQLRKEELEGHNYVLDWVALLPGPGVKRLPESGRITGYWSGRDGAFGEVTIANKPSAGEPTLLAQQGGWMATRQQILRLNTKPALCQGSILPPFDTPMYRGDGQESNNVEFWSGGYQLFTGVLGGCNMRRIISLHPDHFSKHFLYHASNNKQKQLSSKRMVRADHLWGQLNTVRNAAEQAMSKIARP